jgi:hypothetical protein
MDREYSIGRVAMFIKATTRTTLEMDMEKCSGLMVQHMWGNGEKEYSMDREN